MITIDLIAAARPNFMKIAPLYHALAATDWCKPRLVHTGQHYDANMSDVFFEDLRLPTPDFNLGIGSGSHAAQTGGVMIAYEKICMESRPDWVIVVGDVNSTAACALVGTKLGIPVVHLEAGLRSGDRTMPEEINRLVTDAIADVLWTPSPDADENLGREGVSPEKIDRIGNIMIDSFELMHDKIRTDTTQADLGLKAGEYALATLHRPSNVDSEDQLTEIIETFAAVSAELPVLFVAHPRTVKGIERFGLMPVIESSPSLILVEPLAYVRFMNVVVHAKAVITDSGGLQEETTYLGIPCLTLRPNTERPITIEKGTNRLVEASSLGENLALAIAGDWPKGSKIEGWDGKTAARAVEALQRRTNP